MIIRVELDDDLARKFELASNLMGESVESAAVKALAQYTRDALIAGARSIDGNLTGEVVSVQGGGATTSLR